MDSAMLEMRENLDMLKNYLPSNASNPTILKLNPNMLPIMNFSITFEGLDQVEATTLVEDKILPRIERIPGVASVSVSGTSKHEYELTFKQDQIDALDDVLDSANQLIKQMNDQYGLGLPLYPKAEQLIQDRMKGNNLSMPSGYVTNNGIDYIVRVGDKFKSIDEVKELEVFSQTNPITGDKVSFVLDDLVAFNYVNTNDESYSKVNGENAISFSIQKQNNYATTDISKRVNRELDAIKKEFTGSEAIVLFDQADMINTSMGSIVSNLLIGGVLAVVILFVFFKKFKPTLIIALAIPISVMAAFILIYFSGINLNIVSMGGLALGIGMLVDNSIVVIENIYRLRSEGASRTEAAIKGASQVAGAITASTLTTIAVFLPIVFLEGITAEIFKEMALTITYSLVASLVIAITVVPSISTKMIDDTLEDVKEPLLDKVKGFYKRVLEWSLKFKKTTLLVTTLLFAGSLFLAVRVGTEFFPESQLTSLTVSVDLPEGTDFKTTAEALDTVVAKIRTIKDVEYVGATIGGDGLSALSGGSGASINVLLNEKTKKTSQGISDEIANLTSDLPYEVTVSEQGMDMSMLGGSGISIMIKGQELDDLERIADEVSDLVAKVKGTTDIFNGVTKTAPEVKITVDKNKAAEKGFTVTEVFGLIAMQLKGNDAITTLSIEGKEIDIRIKDKAKLTVDEIKNMLLPGAPAPFPLSDIADIDDEAMGFGQINRENQSRYLNVTAQIAEGYNVGKVGNAVEQALKDYQVPSGYTVELLGENAEIKSAFNDLYLALALGVVLIYMIMAAQFQSLRYPFIVMFTIPLAFTGGFLGLFITQTPLSVVAMIGLIILTGIVVNNGIVLVDYINQLKDEGMASSDAIIEAGITRLRPILMTALTTILGLSTMALGIGKGSEMLQPMAITTIGGLIYSTILTLVIIPVIYAAFDKKKSVQEVTTDA